jgi:tetratricopeptide (TPR) repeat protein
MPWSLTSVGRTVLAAATVMACGCAAHQPPAAPGLAGTLVRGADGPGGIAWPAADEAVSGAAADVSAAPVAPAGVTAEPRAFEQVQDAVLLESADPRLDVALRAAVQAPGAGTLRAVAEEYRRLGVFDRAHRYLADALTIDPADGRTREALARLWRDWGVPAEGLGEAYRAVAADPGSAAAQTTLGSLLFVLGHVQAAQATFERVASMHGPTARAESNLCYAAFALGDQERAFGHCQAALALDPSLTAARNNLALVHAAEGRWEQALAEFRAATGDEATAQFNYGVVLLAGRDYGGAIAAFEAALAERPSFALAQMRAGEARRLAGTRGSVPAWRSRD